jgi:hypothetical protein
MQAQAVRHGSSHSNSAYERYVHGVGEGAPKVLHERLCADLREVVVVTDLESADVQPPDGNPRLT